jgi:hypothetical protein
MAAPTSLKAEDKLDIIELSYRDNKSLDHRDVDGWLETWTEDGVIETPYFEIAKGKGTGHPII